VKARRTSAMPRRPDPQRARATLAERLGERRGEIERAVTTRVYAIADPREAADPTYAEGLRAAVDAAIDYGLASIEQSQAHPPQIPAALLAQAHIAARNGVPLDTVLRRYFAGYTIFGDFLVEEAHGEGVTPAELKRILRAQAANFDRLVAAVSEEHGRESSTRLDSAEQRRSELIQRLLAGELVEASELAYDFEGWHLGLAATGRDSAEVIRNLGRTLDRRVLLVRQDADTTWAWLGGRRRLQPDELIVDLEARTAAQVTFALGEPGEGLEGWRLSHRQAVAALPIVARAPDRVIRYSDVALLAAALQDDLLMTSLKQLYLEPLEDERDGGKIARRTLRAYIKAEHNVTSTAAGLNVARSTVASRLHSIEAKIGCPLAARLTDLDLALQLDALTEGAPIDQFDNILLKFRAN
jgi:hypothetical protein